MVLCDISILNPNVFFELGIRTALNKPVCLVMDDITERIPFDMSMIYHQKYKNSLNPWDMKEEIDALSSHLKKSYETSSDSNELWENFGLSFVAHTPTVSGSIEERMDFLTQKIESLKNTTNSINYPRKPAPSRMGPYFEPYEREEMSEWTIEDFLSRY